MSEVLHDDKDNAKAVAIPLVFSECSQANNRLLSHP